MKDRIVFFVLGAVLATVAYFAGDMDKAKAQGPEIFEGDVVIKGGLLVAGGKLIVIENPFLIKGADEVESAVSINADEDSASLALYYNGPVNIGKSASSVELIATNISDGSYVSSIRLSGEYEKDVWSLLSIQDLSKNLSR
jgi:hypothetical protein